MANCFSRLNSVGGCISVPSVWDLTWLDRDKEIEILFYIKLHPQFFLLHIWCASYYDRDSCYGGLCLVCRA